MSAPGRYATVTGLDATAEKIADYLPSNYRLSSSDSYEFDGRQYFVIEGHDHAGWTLEDYVAPRLASGLYGVKEIDLSHPLMKQVPTSGARA